MNRSALFVIGLAFCACGPGTTVIKDTNDTTAPDVVIKIKGTDGQYTAANQAQLSVTGTLDLMCIVSDPGGVASVRLLYLGMADSCTINSSVLTGTFPITPLPAEAQQVLEGDAQGKVLSTLPLLSTLKGPFACTPLGGPKGMPLGATITVQCGGRNWSADQNNNAKVATLAVKLSD